MYPGKVLLRDFKQADIFNRKDIKYFAYEKELFFSAYSFQYAHLFL